MVILFARDFEYGVRDGKGLGHGRFILGLMAVASTFQGVVLVMVWPQSGGIYSRSLLRD